MNNLQLTLLIVSILVLLVVLRNIIRNNMNIGYAMVWILWAIGMVIISLFPGIVARITRILCNQTQSNAVFLITIFLLYCLTFYLYLRISRHNENMVNLNYEIAALKKETEELRKKLEELKNKE